jgi:hypothetical protein
VWISHAFGVDEGVVLDDRARIVTKRLISLSIPVCPSSRVDHIIDASGVTRSRLSNPFEIRTPWAEYFPVPVDPEAGGPSMDLIAFRFEWHAPHARNEFLRLPFEHVPVGRCDRPIS